ncbi:MAG: hypothetical protein ACI9QC_000726 [Oceanicoccus sp.]|jgi:hypothetical protein
MPHVTNVSTAVPQWAVAKQWMREGHPLREPFPPNALTEKPLLHAGVFR